MIWQKKLKDEKGIDVPADKRFVGLDAYKQVIDSGVDVVIVATPPVFRPVHFQYATEKGKHSFLEKPICVDPVGYRTIMATAKQAAAKNLCVVTGTQRHHQRSYVESYKKIMEGLIGEDHGRYGLLESEYALVSGSSTGMERLRIYDQGLGKLEMAFRRPYRRATRT